MRSLDASEGRAASVSRRRSTVRVGAVLLALLAVLLVACGQSTEPVPVAPAEDPPAPPTPTPQEIWQSTDIGSVAFEGESDAEDGGSKIVVSAAGADVWNGEDGFRFTHQPLSGDGSLTVRVDDIDAVHEWTKVGVMVREDRSPSARNAFVVLTDANGAVFQGRSEAGGETSDTLPDGRVMSASEPTAPWWLRIERQGDVLIGSHSPDGTTWSELGRMTIDLPQDVLIGTGVTSTSNDAIATAAFSNVTVQRSDEDVVREEESADEGSGDDPSGDGASGDGASGDGASGDDAAGDDADSGSGDGDPTGGQDGAGSGDEAGETPVPTVPPAGVTTTVHYDRSNDLISNPERGWHGVSNPEGYGEDERAGLTLVRRSVRLDDYRYSDLPSSFLDDLEDDLSALRDHGLKVILRFTYNHGRDADAPLDRVLEHIEQLTPVLREHSDVIAVLQAGFIGAWGEWHSSTNDLLDFEPRSRITNALLDALDESRMIQIRYPYRASDMFPTPPDEDSAFDFSDASRVGQLNDCFVSTSSDGGTFTGSEDYEYVEDVTPYTVMGGETCAIGGLNDRNDGDNALEELERYHYDYLNQDFYRPIIDKWRDQGYIDEMTRRLGYRYVMHEATSQVYAQAGESYSVDLRIENEGFGKLYNPRPIEVVLRSTDGGDTVRLRAADDARTLLPLSGETRDVELAVRVPADLPAGEYDVYLALPDAAETIADDPRYAVRFANEGTWESESGLNDLDVTLEVGN